MPYAMPPQANTNANSSASYGHIQQWHGQQSSRARQAATAAVPNGTVLDVSSDSSGQPQTAHVRDNDGRMHTVRFDRDQNVTQTEDGYC